MRDAVRIFRKDVRHLWPRIAIVWIVLGLHGWYDSALPANLEIAFLLSMVFAPLLYLPAWFLIVSVVQQEALPGDRQYWVTRPISPASLLIAKGLFLLCFLQLPVMLSEIATLAFNGVHPQSLLWPLVAKQVLFEALVVAPAVALAVVTRNLLQFALGGLGMGLLAVLTLRLPVSNWQSAEPVRMWAATAAVVGIVAAILVLEYPRRRTALARAVLAGGALFFLLGETLPPLPGAIPLQSWVSSHPAAESAIRVDFDPANLPPSVPKYVNVGPEEQSIVVPIRMSGVPAGWELRGAAVQADFEAADGQHSRSSWKLNRINLPDEGPPQVIVPIAAAFYQRYAKSPLHLHARLAFTLLAPPRTARLPVLPSTPDALPSRTAQGVGLCSARQTGNAVMVVCAEPLQRSASTVLSTGPSTMGVDSLKLTETADSDTFSMFSAWEGAMLYRSAPNVPLELEVQMRDAASHFIRDLDVRDFRLDRCPISFFIEPDTFSTGWGFAF